MPFVRAPHPCVVYTRQVSGGAYVYSHHCLLTTQKLFPPSLRTTDLRVHDSHRNWSELQRACFLVLVAGDVAQCVSLATARDKARVQFLFPGSAFTRRMPTEPLPTELHDDYVSLHFHGTMAVFDRGYRFHTAIPLESGISLFPKRISEKDIPLLARWVEACLLKSIHSSVWVTDTGHSYNETTLDRNPRVKKESAF
jgi:hypothetical protein